MSVVSDLTEQQQVATALENTLDQLPQSNNIKKTVLDLLSNKYWELVEQENNS